ncbi:peptidoglycan DD-metalloendopeptidase family protein [Hominifimenecus sp. rT4P-3]|uniref:peptidoglycan DD-metalloendopeptidase family protein n=1 Tax=Hominifimenecus sp. rT4P-3 TaxID=3242979 RepID=UPI003DA2D05B
MNKFKRFFSGRLFYSLAVGILAVGIAATGAMLIGKGSEESPESQYLPMDESPEQVVYGTTEAVGELPSPSVKQTETPQVKPERPVAARPTETEPMTTEPVTEKPSETESTEAEVAAPVFSEEDSLKWPIEGEVLREFSMDTTVFYPTLESYRVSPAILIQGAPDMEVAAASAGVVKEINNNEEIGNYIVLDMGGGYEATYGQLKTVHVSTGDTVAAGEVMASLDAPTKYYVVEGCNLYFGVTKDGTPVDPLDYMHE